MLRATTANILGVALLLTASSSSMAQDARTVTSPSRAGLGFAIECFGCEPIRVNGQDGYKYSSPPVLISVAKGSPAEKAGLKPGDVLTHIDGVSITTQDGSGRLTTLRAGVAVNLTVRTEGKARVVSVQPSSSTMGEFTYDYLRGADSTTRQRSLNFQRFGTDSTRASFRRYYDYAYQRDSLRSARDSTLRPMWSPDWSSLAPKTFQAGIAGLELSVEGTKPVKVTVVEPNCLLLIEVDGARIQVRAPNCK